MPAPGWLVARPIAHRGLHARDGRPENTLAAARAAVAAGYAIECDVRLSGDGQVMVFHDETLGRLTGAAGRVDATPASVLAGLKVLGTAETIPTLGDLLATVGGRVPLVVELKSDYSGDPGLARRVAEMVAGYDGPLALKSFDPAIVGQLRPLAPERPRGIVAEATQDDPAYALLPEGLRRALANLLHLGAPRRPLSLPSPRPDAGDDLDGAQPRTGRTRPPPRRSDRVRGVSGVDRRRDWWARQERPPEPVAKPRIRTDH